MTRTLTATIWREDDGFVSLCSERDIASQGNTVEEARSNLKEAVELFFETAPSDEIANRLNADFI
jgi:predicted RNase H-like HicB family nuclease